MPCSSAGGVNVKAASSAGVNDQTPPPRSVPPLKTAPAGTPEISKPRVSEPSVSVKAPPRPVNETGVSSSVGNVPAPTETVGTSATGVA